MRIQSPAFLFFAVALSVLAVTHVLAVTFFLYWTYPWLDIPMHGLGGVVVAFGFLSALERFKWYVHEGFQKGLVLTLCAVLAVGLLWELFELVTDATLVSELNYIGDTALDLIMDIVGGCVGYAFARSVNKKQSMAAHV